MHEEEREWFRQIRRLFIISIIYDLAFVDPFTAFKRLNPIVGLIIILVGSIVYLISISASLNMIVYISFYLLIVGFLYTIIASYRRRPVYIFNLEESEKIIKEKGMNLKDLNDIQHAKAIIEYSLYLSQKASTPEEMKKFLDIAYDVWFKVIKAQSANLYLGIFKRKNVY
jgi:hypothetical protein